ncbi:hypothetical protein PIB30_029305 [Stylosanthes scabra]|uniref:Uncharacterized protein n=1 Tax=Stylosanthes scabra TaxID=79078 RepID=A0ABU6Y9Y7_9FABA|nr:hypothetical protein [Stylosanthes scabra]
MESVAGCKDFMNPLDPTTDSDQFAKVCIGTVAESFGLRRFQQLFEVVQSADPGPTADFIQWWILAARRYLIPVDRFHHLPPDVIPVEATQRQSGPHPVRPDVPHVPDNRRPARRMMVGTTTTARDWQWLDDIMDEDGPAAPPTQKNRRMPVSYACRRGAGRPRRGGRAGRGHGEGGDAALAQ